MVLDNGAKKSDVESGFGVVAQLVERLLCMQEVVGSSPIDSTSFF